MVGCGGVMGGRMAQESALQAHASHAGQQRPRACAHNSAQLCCGTAPARRLRRSFGAPVPAVPRGACPHLRAEVAPRRVQPLQGRVLVWVKVSVHLQLKRAWRRGGGKGGSERGGEEVVGRGGVSGVGWGSSGWVGARRCAASAMPCLLGLPLSSSTLALYPPAEGGARAGQRAQHWARATRACPPPPRRASLAAGLTRGRGLQGEAA